MLELARMHWMACKEMTHTTRLRRAVVRESFVGISR